MAVTLAQAALTETEPVTRGIMELFIEESAVFDRIPIEPIAGNSFKYQKESILPGTGFRTVNEAWTESTGVINTETEGLVILGGDADVDRYLVQTSPQALGSLRATQDRMKVKSASLTFLYYLFNGDVEIDPKGFDGLRKRLVHEQVIDATTPLTGEGALEDLEELFAAVEGGPDVVYAPRELLAKYKSLARQLGGADWINSEITGKREWQWNGVTFIDPGYHWNGERILSYDATNGGDIYAIKWAGGIGEVGVMGISNGGVQAYDLGELQEKPAYRTRIEFYCGLAVQGGQAAARLRAVKRA